MLKLIELENIVSKGNVRNEKDDTIQELVDSINQYGLITPLTVAKMPNGKYEVIAGHRRLEALKIIHEPLIECNVIDDMEDKKDKVGMQLAENIQRKNMSAYEYVEIFDTLIEEYKMSKQAIARYCNKSISWVMDQYKAVQILNAKYGDKTAIPENEKRKSASTISSGARKKRHAQPALTVTGNGFSCTFRKHSYMVYCDDFTFEEALNSFLKEHGMEVPKSPENA